MINKSANIFGSTWMALLPLALLFGPEADAAQSLRLAWSPSASPSVAGYHIYYGNNAANFEYEMDTGTNTSFEVSGLQEGQTDYFVVTSYNAQGADSPPSNMISFIVPGQVKLVHPAGEASPAMISFSVAPGHAYQLQASVDLTTWSTIWQTTATNNAWSQYEDYAGAKMNVRFYRLASQ
jgi:hypothetical protein